MMRFIRPDVPPPSAWLPHLEAAYDARWYSNFGPVHERFEERLTDAYCTPGRRAVLASSATAALTAALIALDVRGRVAVPSFTFAATLQAVRQADCTPVVVDVDERTWELSPASVERSVADGDLAAVVPVRAFGFCRDLGGWDELPHEVPVVVDAAAALGGHLPNGAAAGNQGTVEVFSLHATKVFAIGEGGVAVLPEDRVDAFRRALNFGLPAGDVLTRGFNGKLSELHAAVGLAMLERIDEAIARRNEVATIYAAQLPEALRGQLPPDLGRPPWQTYPVLLPDDLASTDVVAAAKDAGLELRAYYRPAMHEVVESQERGAPDYPISSALASRMVCLPVYSDMADAEVDEALTKFHRAWEQSRADRR